MLEAAAKDLVINVIAFSVTFLCLFCFGKNTMKDNEIKKLRQQISEKNDAVFQLEQDKKESSVLLEGKDEMISQLTKDLTELGAFCRNQESEFKEKLAYELGKRNRKIKCLQRNLVEKTEALNGKAEALTGQQQDRLIAQDQKSIPLIHKELKKFPNDPNDVTCSSHLSR